jgi:hypothetical protein
METRYIASYYIDNVHKPYVKKYSNDPLALMAQATVFIENDYAGAYCEIWDVLKKTVISRLQRSHDE